MAWILKTIAVLSPVIGGFIYGFERIVRARMQNRQGPPLLQPFYDFVKLLQKRPIQVHSFHSMMGIAFFFATWFALSAFLCGPNILVGLFLHILALAFFIIGGFSVLSPYSVMGSLREIVHLMAVEPLLILLAIGLFMVTGTWSVEEMFKYPGIPLIYLPLVFIAFVLAIPAILKKSPFDISEAHQEIIGGPEVDYSGFFYEAIYTAKWIEYVFVFAIVFLFTGAHWWLGLALSLIVFIFVNALDNSTCRTTFHQMIKFAWFILLPLAALNIFVLALWRYVL
jgi:ech hydrogenase subunit B